MYNDEFDLIKKDFYEKCTYGGTLKNFTLIKIINFSEVEYQIKALDVESMLNSLNTTLETIRINIPKYYLEENEIDIEGNEKIVYNEVEYKIQGKFLEGKYLIVNKKSGEESEDYISITLVLSRLHTKGWVE